MIEREAADEQPKLRRVMGPGVLLLFIIGDILGTGVYALIGDIAAEVGGGRRGAVCAEGVQQAVHHLHRRLRGDVRRHQVGFHRITFFAANFFIAFQFNWGTTGFVIVALAFIAVLGAVNLRGVGGSIKLNVVLSCIEATGLFLFIAVGLWAFLGGRHADYSRIVAFDTADHKNIMLAVTTATSLAFFAMVGFEDNMAEETKDPVKTFPKVLLSGLSIAGVVYMLVAITAVALVPVGVLKASDTPLVEVVQVGAPGLPIKEILPFVSMVAVTNTALINMLMASRLIYGMARQRVLPPVLGTVSRARRSPWVAIVVTTAIACGVILYVTAFASEDAIEMLGGTTSLLLLAIFALVNVAVLVLRRDATPPRPPTMRAASQQPGVGVPPACEGETGNPATEPRRHYQTPTALPVIGCVASLYLVTPLSGRPGQQYLLAAILVGSGVLLSFATQIFNRVRAQRALRIDEVAPVGA